MSDATQAVEFEYVLVIPEHGMVGIGPTTDRQAVEQDYRAWLDETGKHGTIMRRPVSDWDVDPEQEHYEPTGVRR